MTPASTGGAVFLSKVHACCWGGGGNGVEYGVTPPSRHWGDRFSVCCSGGLHRRANSFPSCVSGFHQIPTPPNLSVPTSQHARCHGAPVFCLWGRATIQNSKSLRARQSSDSLQSSGGEPCGMPGTILSQKSGCLVHGGWTLL